MDNQNMITFAVNPKEYFEIYKDKILEIKNIKI